MFQGEEETKFEITQREINYFERGDGSIHSLIKEK